MRLVETLGFNSCESFDEHPDGVVLGEVVDQHPPSDHFDQEAELILVELGEAQVQMLVKVFSPGQKILHRGAVVGIPPPFLSRFGCRLNIYLYNYIYYYTKVAPRSGTRSVRSCRFTQGSHRFALIPYRTGSDQGRPIPTFFFVRASELVGECWRIGLGRRRRVIYCIHV